MRMIRRAHAVAAAFLASAAAVAVPMWGLSATAAGISPLQDAVLPADKKPHWGEEPVTLISPTRGEISLNGLWKFLPAEGAAARTPDTGWGYIKVPGSWKDAGSIVARGQGGPWQTWKPDESPAAWYERVIRVPADWKGRAILLDLDRVSTDAVVYVDGKEAGQVRWPAGQVDITRFVTPGREANLRLRVLAVDDRSEVTNYMGYLNEPKGKADLDNRGLIGEGVKLVSRPAAGYVADLLMRPSTRQKTLFVDLEMAEVPQDGELRLTAQMLDEKGVVEKTFTQTLPVRAAKQQTVTAAFPWADPRLWDVAQPRLYTMRLAASGAGVSDHIVQQFGFREFWIDGRRFFLNGTEIQLRPMVLQYGGKPEVWLKQGFNFGELWPDDRGRRGSQTYDDSVIAEADRTGMPISGKAMHMGSLVTDLRQWSKPETRAEYQRLMELDMRRWRNHPSILMWGHSGNVFGFGGDGSPWELGRKGLSNQQEYEMRRRNGLQAIRMIKELDPTRPVFAHFGTDVGDVYTSNQYLNFIPLQEREDWMSEWAKSGELPYMAVEFGTPLYASLMRGRDGYSHQGQSEPNLTEWAAVYLGHEAYRLEPPELRKIFLERYKGTNSQQEYEPHLRTNGYDKILWGSPSFAKVQNLFFRNTWRSWRTMGVTGGMVPWHQTDPQLFPQLYANNGPTLAWIAGPAGEFTRQPSVPNFTRKDHHFAPGQTMRKQVVLINDERTPQSFSARWTVSVGGATVAKGIKSGTVAVAEKRFLPLDIALPKTIPGGRADGMIKLSATIGSARHEDSFAFTVIAPLPSTQGAKLSVFDPVGETTILLKRLGYTIVPWTKGQPSSGVAVIGAKALSSRHLAPGNLDAFVRNGGRLIVFNQDNDWTRLSLQLRTAPYVARRAFPVRAAHPVLRGLEADNLRDWNGAGTVVTAYPHYPGLEWLQTYGWHWGNKGSVSSTPIEKPHRSSWRPILETEFDLAYTPLMEMDYGRGRVTFSTLDLEGRTDTDPAADRLAAQLLQYVRNAPLSPKAIKVIYLGDDAGAKTLDSLGVVYARGERFDSSAALTIVGNSASVTDANTDVYLRHGGKALFLARAPGGSGAPASLRIETRPEFQGSLKVPNWPETAGLSVSDLHWKTVYEGRVLVAGDKGGVEIGADGLMGRRKVGAGVALYTQIDPGYLPADEKHYFRFTRWRQTRALSQLLANLGARFQQDARFMALLQRPEQGYMLAGSWEAQMTKRLPESPLREWNAFQPISEKARSLVKQGPEAPLTGWQRVAVPAYLESYGPEWKWADGETVFRKVVVIPAYLAGKDMFLSVGRVDESEETFVNGESVGSSRSWIFARGHKVPGRLIKAGKNVITIRNWDEGIHGGMCGAPEQIFLKVDAPDAGFYHPDYISDLVDMSTDEAGWKARQDRWAIADNPYRYYRW